MNMISSSSSSSSNSSSSSTVGEGVTSHKRYRRVEEDEIDPMDEFLNQASN